MVAIGSIARCSPSPYSSVDPGLMFADQHDAHICMRHPSQLAVLASNEKRNDFLLEDCLL